MELTFAYSDKSDTRYTTGQIMNDALSKLPLTGAASKGDYEGIREVVSVN